MNLRSRLFCLFSLLTFLMAALMMSDGHESISAQEKSPTQWKPVNDAINQGLPQTAIAELDKILESAIRKDNHALAARAIATRATLDGQLEGRDVVHRITRLQSDLAIAPEPTRPILRAILANWIWSHYQENQWRFRDRTEIDATGGGETDQADAEPLLPIRSSDDMATWSRQRIIAQAARTFEIALADDAILKNTPIEDYDDLLVGGNAPNEYRPTVWDFVVADAIDFFNDAHQTYAGPAKAFELSADSPIFDGAEAFVQWSIPETDTRSPLYRATRLYQDWIAFHQQAGNQQAGDQQAGNGKTGSGRAGNPAAAMDADLNRLQFAAANAVADSNDERYLAALRRFANENTSHPIAARAQFLIATQTLDSGAPSAARQIALAAIQSHPDSHGASQCQSLVDQIEAPSISISTERIWNPDLDASAGPQIEVQYKNLDKVYFRLVALDVDKFLNTGRDTTQLNRNDREALLAARPAQAWAVELPKTDDFQIKTESLPVDFARLNAGYHLIASSSPTFPASEAYTAFTEVWVTRLSLIVQTDHPNGTMDGWVVDGNTGDPISGVNVRAIGRDQSPVRPGRPAPKAGTTIETLETLRTDREGRFSFTGKSIQNLRFYVTQGTNTLLSDEYYAYQNRRQPKQNQTRSFFFTDRAIYRPGQIVKFKVIATRTNTKSNSYEVAAGENLKIELIDANGKVAQSHELRTNDFGSANDSFHLPAGGLTGRMSLRVNGEFSGATSFNVEEYKRPKFEVTLDQPARPSRLSEDVIVPGVTKSYTGAPVDGAKVAYTVTRKTQMPAWYGWRCWWMPMPPAFPQVIATGETETNELGQFEITFNAIPDNTVDRENEPIFNYVVTADVTDTTGETRRDQQTVSVGYATIAATLSVDNDDASSGVAMQSEWLTDTAPIPVRVRTQTLQGSAVSTNVTLKVHRLKSPERIGRAPMRGTVWNDDFSDDPADQSTPAVLDHDPNSWPIAETISEIQLTTDATGSGVSKFSLPSGFYRVELASVDAAGQPVQAFLPLRVISPRADRCELPIAAFVAMPTKTVQPGETFTAVWGSGYESARAHIEIEHRGKILQRFWTPAGQTQVTIEQPVDESMRGGLQMRVFTVRENRLYLDETRIEVPWSNKDLKIRWERFVSKLKPGQTETWTAVIEGLAISDAEKPDAEKSGEEKSGEEKPKPGENTNGNLRLAEMVATMYDASLELFQPHRWINGFGLFYQDTTRKHTKDQNSFRTLNLLSALRTSISPSNPITYRDFPNELLANRYFPMQRNRSSFAAGRGMTDSMEMEPLMMASPMMAAPMMAKGAFGENESMMADVAVAGAALGGDSGERSDDGGPPSPDLDLSDISPRRNLNETAFFFPELTTDEAGIVTMKFTMPEALTRWQMIGFAHTKTLAGGSIRDTAVTSKDLMVQPNPPRMLREGDQIEMTVKVTNQSPTVQTGTVALQFNDARTGESVDANLLNTLVRQSFNIPAGQSQSFSWPITVPDSMGYLTYRAVGSTGRLSDGEEGFLPVLSRRVLVHESIALPIDGVETKTFTLDKLSKSEGTSIQSESLTVQMTSNPSWYAIMALPYLMEYPHECSEQTFNRLYANLLARHIATSDPKIERVFHVWRNQPVAAGRNTLDSPLQQNEDIASIALTETPWVLEAESESEARRNVGILFDQNRTNDQVDRWTRRLAEMQLPDGSWPWFAGGRSNSFITLYLTTGFGRLRHLGVDVDMTSAIEALQSLDRFAVKQYTDIQPAHRDRNHMSSTLAMYLYGRSFFLDDLPIAADAKVAVDYWIDQASRYWLDLPGRMSQAHASIALKRFGKFNEALAITASLKERSVTDDQGMHWNDVEGGWLWYQADIESQAMMIEAFDEVAGDPRSVESCKAWLLRQKETRSWETTKGTADAIYALLLRGVDLLADPALVDVKVGESPVGQSDVEAGTGFFQQRFAADQIEPSMGSITVTKTTPGIAWGGVHWKYFQNIDEVTPHEGTPLKVEKQLFVVRSTPTGEVMQPIVDGKSAQTVQPGDEIVARLIVRTDRAMEFIHLKDGRGSGTEPTNVLSGYRFQDGIAYYQSTRDAAEHFFIDYLPEGTFVLESRSRVQLRGEYESGLATIESMYAPQYNSHSESQVLKIGR